MSVAIEADGGMRAANPAVAPVRQLLTARTGPHEHGDSSLSPPAGESLGLGARSAQQAACKGLAFEIVRARAAFDSLEADWNDLFERAGSGAHVFQTFNWCWHWTRHYLPEHSGKIRLAIVTARHRGRLVLVWPLVVERVAGLRQIAWMGGPPAQYGDILVDPDLDPGLDVAAAIAAAHQYLVAEVPADLMRLRLVRADATIAPHLARSGARVTETYEAPYLDLASAADFATYETRYPAKARKNRRRLLRRLDERAEVRFDDLVPSALAADMAATAITMKRRWLESRNLVSKALACDRMIAFMRSVAESQDRPVGCEVSVLRAGSDAASVQIGFRCRDRLALHVIVFDLDYEKAGAGVLHLEHAVARACVSGASTLDLLAPRSDYKMDWADGATPVADYALPLTLAGRLYIEAYLMRLRARLKVLAPHLPARLRQWASNA